MRCTSSCISAGSASLRHWLWWTGVPGHWKPAVRDWELYSFVRVDETLGGWSHSGRAWDVLWGFSLCSEAWQKNIWHRNAWLGYGRKMKCFPCTCKRFWTGQEIFLLLHLDHTLVMHISAFLKHIQEVTVVTSKNKRWGYCYLLCMCINQSSLFLSLINFYTLNGHQEDKATLSKWFREQECKEA